MVVPSCAVTTVVMVVLVPSVKATGPDAVPDVTAAPFTVIVALGSCVTGVTVTDAVTLAAVVVYVVVLPLVPALMSVEAGVSAMMPREAFARMMAHGLRLLNRSWWLNSRQGDVTTVLMVVVVPSAKATGSEAVPVATGMPLTVIVAVGSTAVGVTVTDAVALLTEVV